MLVSAQSEFKSLQTPTEGPFPELDESPTKPLFISQKSEMMITYVWGKNGQMFSQMNELHFRKKTQRRGPSFLVNN